MKSKFINLLTAIRAEHIKKRGTGFYWTSAIMGLISPVLYFTVLLLKDSIEPPKEIPFNYYLKFITDSSAPFTYFFIPLFIIIMVSRITQIDHKNGGWQLMETQPLFKFSIYFSKLATILIANILAIVSFLFFCVVGAYLHTQLIPVPKVAILEIPMLKIFELLIRLFLASLFITAIQYVVSVLISSFIWSILIGFFGLLLTSFLTPFDLIPVWYPFTILTTVYKTIDGSDLNNVLLYTEYISLFASVLILYIGYKWYEHKTFKLAFISKPSRTLELLIVSISCSGILIWILQPNQMKNHHKTLISGTVESPSQFKNMYIKDAILNDTIAIIPINNNKFHYHLAKNIVSDYYIINIDGQDYKNNLFFGTKDSLYINAKIYPGKNEFEIKGTRLAENQVQPRGTVKISSIEFEIVQNIKLNKPSKIADEIYNEWKKALAEPNKYRTIDNYEAKSDFTVRSEKLITTKYLNLWNDLVNKRLALYPNEKTLPTAKIKEIQKALPLDDESLLSNEDYFNFVRKQLVSKNTQDIDDNSKAIAEISKLKPNDFKDKILFWQVRKSLQDATSSGERSKLLADNQPRFVSIALQKKIGYLYKTIESLGRGKNAPEIFAQTIKSANVKLSSLKGKFIIIDVWATWCGPCNTQAPYFEKFAMQFKKEKIHFLSLSIDKNKKQWFIASKNRTKSVQQWRVTDLAIFSKNYGIETIPRFVLIDPKGKIVNAKMPFPSDDAFEIILKKEMNIKDVEYSVF